MLAKKRAEIETGFLSENRSLTSAEIHPEALAGIGRPASRLLILAAMYTTPGMFAFR